MCTKLPDTCGLVCREPGNQHTVHENYETRDCVVESRDHHLSFLTVSILIQKPTSPQPQAFHNLTFSKHEALALGSSLYFYCFLQTILEKCIILLCFIPHISDA